MLSDNQLAALFMVAGFSFPWFVVFVITEPVAALFCVMPFATLLVAWGVGLAFLTPKAVPVRVKDRRHAR